MGEGWPWLKGNKCGGLGLGGWRGGVGMCCVLELEGATSWGGVFSMQELC